MTSSVRIGSSTNSSTWPPKVPGNDVFSSNSCSVPKLATLPFFPYQITGKGHDAVFSHWSHWDFDFAVPLRVTIWDLHGWCGGRQCTLMLTRWPDHDARKLASHVR